jgi:predicted RNase H-like nuclease (RuvC/YqgF family)
MGLWTISVKSLTKLFDKIRLLDKLIIDMKIFNIIKANQRIEELEKQLADIQTDANENIKAFEQKIEELNAKISELNALIKGKDKKIAELEKKAVQIVAEAGVPEKIAAEVVKVSEINSFSDKRMELMIKSQQIISPTERTRFLMENKQYFGIDK